MNLYVCWIECALQDDELAYAGAERHFSAYLKKLRALAGVRHVERGAFTTWDDRRDRFTFRACVVVDPAYPFRADPVEHLRPGLCEAIDFSAWTGPFEQD